ncbi:MAG: ribosome silencing factor [Spirochaetales bacterium]|jgi:ribosome-associated protein|nr:ribosome silencing factor [Spirochaetales bacterium]
MIDDDTEHMVKSIASFIDEHKGSNTICIDVSEVSSWTDSFIISTVQSTGHLKGLIRELRSFLHTFGIYNQHRHKKISEHGWELLDCGDIVIHLMSEESRSFYELE